MTEDDHVLAMLLEMFGDVEPFDAIQKVALSSAGDLDAAVHVMLSQNNPESIDASAIESHADNCETTDMPVDAFTMMTSGKQLRTNVNSLKRMGESYEGDHPPKLLRHNSTLFTSSTQTKELASPSTDTHSPKFVQPNALSLLKWPSNPSAKATASPLQIQLAIYNIRDHIPCELFLDFLPAEVADELLVWLMVEAKTWEEPKYTINHKEKSANRRSFYLDKTTKKTNIDWAGERYVRPTIPLLSRVCDMVQKKVCELGVTGWIPNAVLANEYRNGKEVKGLHSDKLTYLGPLPTIASMTLGAERMFRIKRISRPSGPSQQTYNVSLPHRSLLVMLPTMQEEFKHELPPQKTVVAHPISDEARYNLTFRMYRDEFRDPPMCNCKIASEMRPVLMENSTFGRYYFHCSKGRTPNGCNFFEWLDRAKVPKSGSPLLLNVAPTSTIQ
ncbi:hypothetical protein BC829DRAFT_127130 [Chytridium lagenaria]|nr:hypothetical protein BC829DRAFT_127130 [Chytridium lagenaria]